MPNIVNLVTVTYKHTDAMNKSSVNEMPDPLISTPDINFVLNNESNNILIDETDSNIQEYKKEMIKAGLDPADVLSFENEFTCLENVQSKRIHCTSCDKHIGNAPNDLQNRYEHPLLKVLICGECFQFYSSGDFEKDEDGSELYCRWCGEGGQVFCCTKCPFVFCKKCIRRNLGKATAKIIEDSDNWNCFSCDRTQICHLRATYWAIQKYSEEMIKKSKINGDVDILSVDNNTCCNALKRKNTLASKSGQAPAKKLKIIHFTSSNKKSNKPEIWEPPCISQEPEDEVICTPDIIPLVDSPLHSPEREHSPSPTELLPPPPPVVPLAHQKVPFPILPKIPTLRIRPPVSLPSLQKQLSSKLSQIILTPPNQIRPGSTVVLRKSLSNKTTPNNGNRTIVSKVVVPRGQKYYKVSKNNSGSKTPVPTTSKVGNNGQDWFNHALNDCAAIAAYITSNVENLSDLHSRAHLSEKVMRELHNAIQTYMHVAIEKIKRMKNVIRSNFEQDFAVHFKRTEDPSAVEDNTSSDDNNSRDSHSCDTKVTGYVLTKNVKPDDVLFDMDVTNASDEENQSEKNSTVTTPTNIGNKIGTDSDDDIEIVNTEKNNEVIQIMDSDDEREEEQNQNISGELLQKIKAKYNINYMSSEELTKYLSAVIVLTKKEKQELSNDVNKNIIDNTVNALLNDSVFTDSNKDKNNEEILEANEEMALVPRDETRINNIVPITQDEENLSENRTEDSEVNNENSVSNSNKCNIQEEEDKEMCDIEDILGSNIVVRQNKLTLNNDDNNDDVDDDGIKEMCDIEDILSSNIVLRKQPTAPNFDDAFNKFVSQKSDLESHDVPDIISDGLKETINMVQELDIPEYVNDICTNRDNGSLSIPPETGITANEMDLLMAKVSKEEINKGSNDAAVNSEILTLQQMAENCVTSVDVHQNSTKCKG